MEENCSMRIVLLLLKNMIAASTTTIEMKTCLVNNFKRCPLYCRNSLTELLRMCVSKKRDMVVKSLHLCIYYYYNDPHVRMHRDVIANCQCVCSMLCFTSKAESLPGHSKQSGVVTKQ